MAMTRRQFNTAAGSLLALTVVGCGDSGQSGESPTPSRRGKHDKMGQTPFLIGSPTQYLTPGVYERHAVDGRGVWLVSDGQMLVAIAFACTHQGCAVDWNQDQQQFFCPCHRSLFDRQGINQPGAKAKRPLERCPMRLLETPQGSQIEVDPRVEQRLRQETGGWSEPQAAIALADTP